MPACAGCDGDDAVGALLDRLVRKAVVDHVMHHDPAIGMDGRVDVLARAQRGDDDRRLVLDAKFKVLLHALIRLVHDLVDRERRDSARPGARDHRRRVLR